MNIRFSISLLPILLAFAIPSFAQEIDDDKRQDPLKEVLSKGLKINLTEDGKNTLKFGMGFQMWARYSDMNPGTANAQTLEAADSHFDFSIRRARLTMMANFDKKFIFFTQFGNTSLPFYAGQTSNTFFHDFWGKVRIANNTYLGAGQHAYSGLSRLTDIAYSGTLAIDNPGFSFPNVNVNDKFVRQLGVFLHGKVLGRLNYELAVNQPYPAAYVAGKGIGNKVAKDQDIIEGGVNNTAYNRGNSSLSQRGYASWSFLYNEPVKMGHSTSLTYFGKKGKILNVGAGFQYHNNASGVLRNADAEAYVEKHHQLALAADIFFETPLAKGSALSAYGSFYHYDYGDNYLWKTTVMGGFATANPTEEQALQGHGIQQYTLGTGNIATIQAGYLMPETLLNNGHRLMPFAAVYYKDFDGLNGDSWQGDFGLHYLIYGNNMKVSAQYSSRPIYNSEAVVEDHEGMWLLQLQLKL
ncbi:hypothetical protein V6R21_31725 [Limibacter armeniacum]|uniref:hypothetical protein n=1 Tax=Limibacter armeniacum TaxID=466084 RepID=UPI002FE5D227